MICYYCGFDGDLDLHTLGDCNAHLRTRVTELEAGIKNACQLDYANKTEVIGWDYDALMKIYNTIGGMK